MKRYYSPQLDRDLVRALYYEARFRGIPMTRLASQLLWEALARRRERYRGADAQKRDGRLL